MALILGLPLFAPDNPQGPLESNLKGNDFAQSRLPVTCENVPFQKQDIEMFNKKQMRFSRPSLLVYSRYSTAISSVLFLSYDLVS